MKFLANISRLLVGSLFTISGLIKANDALGFSYKLEEYFAPKVLDLPFLEPYALELSVIICVVEVALGFAVLFGNKMRITSWILLLMILFFTWLTFYSAYFGVVKDCGCFGDALKLTPWQSFSKDVVLLVFVLVIFFNRGKTELNSLDTDKWMLPLSIILVGVFSVAVLNWWFPIVFMILVHLLALLIKKIMGETEKTEWLQIGAGILFTMVFSFYCLHFLPIKDFRPYAVGKSIPEQMSVPDELAPVYETTFIYKNKGTGEKKEFPQDNLPMANDKYDADNWEYVDRNTKLVKEGKTPKITDFIILQGDQEVTDKVIGSESSGYETGYVFVSVAYNIRKTDIKAQKDLSEFAQKASNKGYSFYGLTSSGGEDVQSFRHDNQIMFPYLSADETLLKTIIRSNPGLLLLKDGKVLGKWPHTSIPSLKKVEKDIIKKDKG